MPSFAPDDILRFLQSKGFLSSAEAELAEARWNPSADVSLLDWLAKERLLPTEVAQDLKALLADNVTDGLAPHLPGLMLLKMIGKGGRGRVYRAWQPSLRRLVAVKILSPELADNREYVRRFLREARVASRVTQENIVRAYDINRKGPHVYMVMEYVAGTNLGSVLRSVARLRLADAFEIARLTATALAYIARVGLVHRDIKPDNIMIDQRGRVKLCDLGLARPSGDSNLTSPMVAQGTPAYMAPENLHTPEAEISGDVYSLGVTLYRMLLGKLPFDHSDPSEVMRMHVEEAVPGLDESSGLPGALTDLIAAMMDKDPTKRPPIERLPNLFAALAKTLPDVGRPELWRLVLGGKEPVEGQEALTLEPTDAMAKPENQTSGQAPAVVAWKSPEIAPRPTATMPVSRSNRWGTMVGFAALALALAICMAYIVVMGFRDDPIPPEDPRVGELKTRNAKLQAALNQSQSRHADESALRSEAERRLVREMEFERKRLATTASFGSPGRVVDSLSEMQGALDARSTD